MMIASAPLLLASLLMATAPEPAPPPQPAIGASDQALIQAIRDLDAKNYPDALRAFKDLAAFSHPVAQYYLGLMTAGGLGRDVDSKEACDWFQRAADGGAFPPAQFALGRCYESGQGRDKSDNDALAWYSAAAANKNPDGLCALGVMTMQGRGVKADIDKGIRLCGMAASLGHVKAQIVLAELYQEGIVVKQDLDKAVALWAAAMKAGRPEAYLALGLMHRNGTGVAKDMAKAIEFLAAAAERGHLLSQYELGKTYYMLAFSDRDKIAGRKAEIEKAYHWLSIASQNLEKADKIKADKAIDELLSIMPQDVVQRLDAAIAAWQAKR